MAIMTRILRLCKADVHGVMDQLEDKELLLKQYLREMRASLDQKEQRVNALTSRICRQNNQISRHGEEMKKLESDVNLALKKERDDIARALIRRRLALETACAHLREQVQTMTQEKTQLSTSLADQHLQYDALKAKTEAFCRRSEARLFEAATGQPTAPWATLDPSDEAVELELLQRKEALQEGGNP